MEIHISVIKVAHKHHTEKLKFPYAHHIRGTKSRIETHFLRRFPKVWSSLLNLKTAALGTFVSFSISIFLSPSKSRNDSNDAGAFIARIQQQLWIFFDPEREILKL